MLKSIFSFFEAIGKARAANHLATLGHYHLAKEIMLRDDTEFEVHP